MTHFMRVGSIRLIFIVFMLNGCATAPWHENLMTNEQLINASCPQLAVEERRVSDNAKHMEETSSIGAFGAVMLGALEIMAASATKKPIDTNNSAAMNTVSLSDEHTKQKVQLEGRKNMIVLLRDKKGCS